MRIGVSTVRRLAGSLALLIAVAGLSACGLTPRQQIQAADAGYTGLLAVGVDYAQRPTCAPGSPVICSKPDVVRTLQTIDRGAEVTLDNAQTLAADPSTPDSVLSPLALAASAALAALQAYATEQGLSK